MVLPTVILPGYLAGAAEYRNLESALQNLGIPTTIAPVRWQDWIPTLGGRSVTPILRILDATVKQVLQKYNVSQINLVGHSAGGWLSRIYMGEKPYCIHPGDTEESVWCARSNVATLITLGTPHISQERWTRRNLDFVNLTYPGHFTRMCDMSVLQERRFMAIASELGWLTVVISLPVVREIPGVMALRPLRQPIWRVLKI